MNHHFCMHHSILLVACVALGGCSPIFEAEHRPSLKTARNSQPGGLSTTNNSSITIQTITLSKEVNTTLAGLILLLVVGTYWLLMTYTTTMSYEIVLPSSSLQDNIAAILSRTWPKHYIGPPKAVIDGRDVPDPWMLFHRLDAPGVYLTEGKVHMCSPKGVYDIEPFGSYEPKPSFMARQRIFSPVMKGLVHIAIWNSVSFWLVLVMIIDTLVYNGFLSKNITTDSITRLLLISVYAVASFGHQLHIATLLYYNFTFVLYQTCWTIISKKFVFLDKSDYTREMLKVINPRPLRYEYKDHLDKTASNIVWTSFNFDLFGTTERSSTYRLPLKDTDQIQDSTSGAYRPSLADDQRRGFLLIARDKIESKLDKFIKPLREAEIKAYEKAVDSTLEKTLANVVVLFGICLATALAPWTSVQTFNATNAQLGSYALLLSISTGFLALVSSMTQLSNATESAKILLLFQEKTIGAINFHHEETENVSKHVSLRDIPDIGFSRGIAGQSPLTRFSLWKSTSLLGKLSYLLLGSALALIPSFYQDQPTSVNFKLKGFIFGCIITGNPTGEILRPTSDEFFSNEETRQERHSVQAAERDDAEREVVVDEEEVANEEGISRSEDVKAKERGERIRRSGRGSRMGSGSQGPTWSSGLENLPQLSYGTPRKVYTI